MSATALRIRDFGTPATVRTDAPPDEAFASDPAHRYRALLEDAQRHLKARRLDAAEVALWRCLASTGYRDVGVVTALSDVYRQREKIDALQELWKRAAVAALEQGDLNGFLNRAYVSIYAEQSFSRHPNYDYARVDEDLNTYARIAARMLSLHGWVRENRRATPFQRAERSLRVGFVLEGFSMVQAPTRTYFPLAEQHDADRFELFFYSRISPHEPIGVKERYAETMALFTGYGVRSWAPARPLTPEHQIEALARRIVEDEIDALAFQTTYFVPPYNVLSCLRTAPFQFSLEHQQPEFSREVDLVYAMRKGMLESGARTAPLPLAQTSVGDVTPHRRADLGIPDDAIVLVSANRETRFRQETFWKAVTAVMERHRHAHFIAVGLSDAAPHLPEHPHLLNRILTPGFREDVPRWLASADVYLDIFPSGGGSSIIEALQAGLPTVCLEQDYLTPYTTNNETISDYVDEPELVVPRRDPHVWQDLVDRLITDGAYRAAMSERMRRRATFFEPACVAGRFFDTLEESFFSAVRR